MIRRAAPQDATAIAAIWNPIIRDTTITFTTREKSIPDITALLAQQPVWVAGPELGPGTDAGLGFATLAPFRAGPGYAHTAEHSIHLSPEARGQGLGRALMTVLTDHARDRGLHSLIAGISGDNSAALAFHTRLGFRQVGHLPEVGWKFDRWHDLVLMQKFL